jgi:predicted outer membrane repeat protein
MTQGTVAATPSDLCPLAMLHIRETDADQHVKRPVMATPGFRSGATATAGRHEITQRAQTITGSGEPNVGVIDAEHWRIDAYASHDPEIAMNSNAPALRWHPDAPRKTRLAAQIALLLALSIEGSGATEPGTARVEAPAQILVTSCADDGSPGTLRSAIASAVNGDSIDLSTLTCSEITLASGQIPIGVDNLTLQGPGQNALTINGQSLSRLFFHMGYGTLSLHDLSIKSGKYASYGGTIGGGCIRSWGSVGLYNVTASYCSAQHQGCGVPGCVGATGGAIYALGDVTVSHSTLTHNSTISVGLGGARGAAIEAVGGLTMKYSTIDDNSASADSGYSSFGGGIVVGRGATISDSTISNNAATIGGGLLVYGDGAVSSLIANSTISGNFAVLYGGGIYSKGPMTIQSTTIAFNGLTQAGHGAGIFAEYSSLELDSTIVSNNLANGVPLDVDGIAAIGGSHNLVIASTLSLPPDTISSDPMLGPLGTNGGETRTHALPISSSAVDTGFNAAGSGYDQRGGGFPRVVGAAADIGAYESANPIVDRIFADGFDS